MARTIELLFPLVTIVGMEEKDLRTGKYVVAILTTNNGQDEQVTLFADLGIGQGRTAAVIERLKESLARASTPLQLKEVMGGGCIIVERRPKTIFLLGRSVGYGEADHRRAAHLVHAMYPDHTIMIKPEGTRDAEIVYKPDTTA